MSWKNYLTEIERQIVDLTESAIKRNQKERQAYRKRANKRMERAAQKARKEDQ